MWVCNTRQECKSDCKTPRLSPDKIHAVFIEAYNKVMINKEKPYNEQQLTIKHELSHILLGHFQNERAKDEEFYLKNYENLDIENDANRYADQMTDDEFSELMKYQIGEAVYL